MKRSAQWRTVLGSQFLTLPAADAEMVLEDRARWMAYAKALEKAGRWRE